VRFQVIAGVASSTARRNERLKDGIRGTASMAMLCPSCGKSFEQQQASCPACAVALVFRNDSPRTSSFDLTRAGSDWSTTPWIRLLMAVLLAQGLYYALFSVMRAGVLALGNEDLFSFVTWQALQLTAVTLGGMVAGAGQRNGMINGAVVGIWNGAIFLVVESFSGQSFSFVQVYSLPMLHTAFGALGGLLGGWSWPPPIEFRRPIARPPSSMLVHRSLPKLLTKHVHWARVLAGVAIAVGGYIYAETLLDLTRQMAYMRRSYHSALHDDLMTWELRVLALIVGGAFSGSCTFNGSVQGAWVGLLSCILLTGLRLGYYPGKFDSLLWMMGLVLAVPFFGGWFGGKLLPPLLPEPPKGYQRISY
jgi:hypothetical protein